MMTVLYMVISQGMPYDKLCGAKKTRLVKGKKFVPPKPFTSPDEPF